MEETAFDNQWTSYSAPAAAPAAAVAARGTDILTRVVNWGIAGTGKVSHDFTVAIQMVYGNNRVVAVGSDCNLDSMSFANEFELRKAYGSYEQLSQDEEVDVVYIGADHIKHYDICRTMITGGKNVLCEKPLAMNLAQTKSLIEYARETGVFFMEGFWSKCFPVYKQIRSRLANGSLGEIRHVYVSCGVDMLDSEHFVDKKRGGGALMDIGCYTAMFLTMVYGERPDEVHATAKFEQDTDVVVNATCYYKNGAVGQMCVNATCELDNIAVICGTKGKITIPYLFWCPTRLITPQRAYDFPLPQAPRPMHFGNSEGLMYEVQEVRNCIIRGEKESPLMTHEMTLINAEILEEIKHQVGIVHATDTQPVS